MSIFYDFIFSFWDITVLMHGYILLGLIAAGIIKEFISDEYIRKSLGGTGLMPSVRAAVLGLPLPMCSCSVIPLAVSLRKSGAGKGAVTSFFISTPMTGVDSIIATYGVFGGMVTFLRVVSASIAAVLAGYFTDRFVKDDQTAAEISYSCGCENSCCETASAVRKTIPARVRSIFSFAFKDLLDDLAYPLFTGLIMAAVIMLVISPELAMSGEGAVFGYLLAFAAGIPLYVCSISAIPISLSLLLAGFTPGAAFVFLAGAPATNIIAVNVVKKMIGDKGAVIYLASIIIVTLVFALIVDAVFADGGLAVKGFTEEDESGLMTNPYSAGVFLAVIAYISVKKKLFRR
jgi:uncharacterized membrane protein YraQ (UPF0718 family)